MKNARTPIILILALLMTVAGCSKGQDSSSSEAALGSSAPSEALASRDGKVESRKLKRHAYLTIEVDDEGDVDTVIDATRGLTDTYGGYVASESTSSIEVMIPTERLDEALTRVGETGEVSSKNVSVQDVTAQYVDLEARIDNLENMRTRIQGLLARSGDMEEMLTVEKELNRVTTELEQARGQMRRMQRDTTYARLHVRVEEKVRPGPVGWIFYGAYKGVKWLFIWD